MTSRSPRGVLVTHDSQDRVPGFRGRATGVPTEGKMEGSFCTRTRIPFLKYSRRGMNFFLHVTHNHRIVETSVRFGSRVLSPSLPVRGVPLDAASRVPSGVW